MVLVVWAAFAVVIALVGYLAMGWQGLAAAFLGVVISLLWLAGYGVRALVHHLVRQSR